MTGKVNTDRNK